MTVRKYGVDYPRQFDCRYCGRHVAVDVPKDGEKWDQRSVFCSHHCERQFWRDVTRHPTHLTNYVSFSMYKSGENRENKMSSIEQVKKELRDYEKNSR